MAEPLRVITQTESWRAEAQRCTVELLRQWVEKAEAGEIVAVSLAAECADGLCMTEFTRPRSRITMIGALERMKYHLQRDMDEV